MKRVTSIIFFFLFYAVSLHANAKLDIKNGTILHCWCWSFNSIKNNIPKIKEAGFTAIQTSPVNNCLEGENGGMELMSSDDSGKWYYHYQPTDFKIGNYQLGTRDEFIGMCKAAHDSEISVIVDIVPNHTTPMIDEVSKEMIEFCGGIENFYHNGGGAGVRNYLTNGKIGGLPDINTENPKFQEYFSNFLKDLADCGADGFRIDCAKHIALKDDPQDDENLQNNFYSIFNSFPDKFIYGEVLQDQNSREEDYGKIMAVTASNYGKILRSSVKNKKIIGKGLVNFQNKASPNLVTWVESHDTYANKGESADLSNFEIRCAWTIIASRKEGTPLFFSRPKGKEGVQFPGESKIGDAGNDQYMNNEVKAVNLFRLAMTGENNMLLNGENSGIMFIKRGKKGVAIINMNREEQPIGFRCGLPDGQYTDRAWKLKFKVKGGVLIGKIPPEKIAVIY